MNKKVHAVRSARQTRRMGRESRRGILSVYRIRRGRRQCTSGLLRWYFVQRYSRIAIGQTGRLDTKSAHKSGLFTGHRC